MTDTHADETYARWDLDGDRTVKLTTEPHRTVAVFAQPTDARRAVVAVNAQTAPTAAEQEHGLDDLRGQQASPDVWMALIDARAEVQRQENRLRQAQARGLDVDLIGQLGQAAIDACESLPYDMRKRPEPTDVMVGRHLLENAATVDLRSVWVARAQRTVDALQADVQRLTGNIDMLGRSLDARNDQVKKLRGEVTQLRAAQPFPRQETDGSTVIGPECFATYPLGDSKMPAAIRVTGERAICWQGEWFYAGEPIDTAPPALPGLPVAHARRSPYPGGGVTAALVGEAANSWWLSRDTAAKQAAIGLAVVREFDQMAAEAAAVDTTSDTSRVVVGGRYVVGENPTVIDMDSGARMPATVAQEGEAMVVLAIDSRGNARGRGWRDDGPTWPMLDPRHLTPAPVEADTTPDTSRVTFGTRHEGTGTVLLQHADIPREWWGFQAAESAKHHRRCATDPGVFPEFRTAHAALAEVRQALDAAQATGVDVDDRGASYSTLCGSFGPLGGDDITLFAGGRARRFLAREVQALVDQGLRGQALNARALPYEVRDHRAPLEAAARTSVEAPLVHFKPYGSYQSSCGISPLREGPDTTDERARTTCQDCRACFRNPSDAERAARTGEAGDA